MAGSMEQQKGGFGMRPASLLIAALMPIAACAQVSRIETPFSSGAFVFSSVKWTLPSEPSSPWFWAAIHNDTGTMWDEITFRIKITGGDDREYVFEVGPVRFEDKVADVSLLGAYPPSAVPPMAASAEIARGIRIFRDKARLYDGPVVTDRACRKDYVDALQLAGLAQRKRIAELVTFGCLELSGDAEIASVSTAETVVSGSHSEAFSLATLLLAEGVQKHGWVLSREISTGMRDHLVQYSPKSGGK